MSLQYSQGQVETKAIDSSRYSANRNVEFSLDEKNVKYLSNMRLINLGCTAANTPKYNQLGGAHNLIKNVTLYNGREELCSMRNAHAFLNFQETRYNNSKNRSVNNELSQSAYGYQNSVGGIRTGGGSINISADPATTPSAFLQLSECLPLLEQMNAFDTQVFSNLRLVIEFETSPYRVISTADAITTIEPTLLVDIVRGNMQTTQQASWLEIEHEQYNLAGKTNVGDTNPATVHPIKKTIRLMGYDNKSVERLLLVKQFDDVSKWGTGETVKNSSLAIYAEEFQLRINGSNVFPTTIDKDCYRQSIMADAWGDLNVCEFNHKVFENDTEIDNTQNGLVDYTGCNVSQFVKDMQIEHNRSCINDSNTASKANLNMVVHVYAEVRKVLLIKGNDFVVQYA